MSAVCSVLPMIQSASKRRFRVLRCRRFVQPCLVRSCMIDTCAKVMVRRHFGLQEKLHVVP